jgi:hypothetical protein
MEINDRVRVIAAGTFHDHTGFVSRITQYKQSSVPYYWITFDAHPWQKQGVAWAFVERELSHV